MAGESNRYVFAISLVFLFAGGVMLILQQRHVPETHDESVSTIDFGKVRAGETVDRKFRVVNMTNEPLSVTKTVSACGCTVAEPAHSIVPESGGVDLEVSLNTSEKSGDTSSAVTVFLSNGTKQEFVLTGFVYNPKMKPIQFGSVKRGADTRGTAELKWPDSEDLSVEKLSFDHDFLEVEHEAVPLSRKIILHVRLASGLNYGPFSSTVTVTTDNAYLHECTFQVKGYVQSPIELHETTIAAGQIMRGEPSWVFAEFRTPYGDPLMISNIEYVKGEAGNWRVESKSQELHALYFQLMPPGDDSKEVVLSKLRVDATTGSFNRSFEIEALGLVGP